MSLEKQRQTDESERARRLSAILASMYDALLVVDEAGQPALINAAYDQMFGDTPESNALASEDSNGNLLPLVQTPQQRAALGETFSMEFLVAGDADRRRWFEANGRPIEDADGHQHGGVVVIRDISDRRFTSRFRTDRLWSTATPGVWNR